MTYKMKIRKIRTSIEAYLFGRTASFMETEEGRRLGDLLAETFGLKFEDLTVAYDSDDPQRCILWIGPTSALLPPDAQGKTESQA